MEPEEIPHYPATICPRPDLAERAKHTKGVSFVISTTATSSAIVAAHNSQLAFHVIVGLLLGLAMVAVILLIVERKPKRKTEMSPAFTQALENLKAAFAADKAKAVAAVQTQLDAANQTIADLQTKVNTGDAEETQALVDATNAITAQ